MRSVIVRSAFTGGCLAGGRLRQEHSCPEISTLFPDTPSNDPIAGMAHQLVALCPVSDSHQVSGAPFESQKLVETGTRRLRNDFRFELKFTRPNSLFCKR